MNVFIEWTIKIIIAGVFLGVLSILIQYISFKLKLINKTPFFERTEKVELQKEDLDFIYKFCLDNRIPEGIGLKNNLALFLLEYKREVVKK